MEPLYKRVSRQFSNISSTDATYRLKFGRFVHDESRRKSFKGWPLCLDFPPHLLAHAGLFYTGYGNYVRCYFCGGGLDGWQIGDIPLDEHARFYPTCPFALEKTEMQCHLLTSAAQACTENHFESTDVQAAIEIYIGINGDDKYRGEDLCRIVFIFDHQENSAVQVASANGKCKFCNSLVMWTGLLSDYTRHCAAQPQCALVQMVRALKIPGGNNDGERPTTGISDSQSMENRLLTTAAARSCIFVYGAENVKKAIDIYVRICGDGEHLTAELLGNIIEAIQKDNENSTVGDCNRLCYFCNQSIDGARVDVAYVRHGQMNIQCPLMGMINATREPANREERPQETRHRSFSGLRASYGYGYRGSTTKENFG